MSEIDDLFRELDDAITAAEAPLGRPGQLDRSGALRRYRRGHQGPVRRCSCRAGGAPGRAEPDQPGGPAPDGAGDQQDQPGGRAPAQAGGSGVTTTGLTLEQVLTIGEATVPEWLDPGLTLPQPTKDDGSDERDDDE